MTTTTEKVSALPAAQPLVDADIVMLVQSETGVLTTTRTTVGAIRQLVQKELATGVGAGVAIDAADILLLTQAVSSVETTGSVTMSALVTYLNAHLTFPDSTKVAINPQAGAYTFVPSDAGKVVRHTSGSAVNATIDTNANQAFALTQVVTGRQVGNGQVTIVAASGVTLNVPTGLTAKTRAKGSDYMLHYVAADQWDLTGDLST